MGPSSHLFVRFAVHIVARWIANVGSSPVVAFVAVVATSAHAAVVERPVELNIQVSRVLTMDMNVAPLNPVEMTNTYNSLHCCMDCGVEVAPYQMIFVLPTVEKRVVQTVLEGDVSVVMVSAEPV